MQLTDLPAFTDAYMQCALATETLGARGATILRERGWMNIAPERTLYDAGFRRDDLHASARVVITASCSQFAQDNADDLAGLDPEAAGHDFWMSRNHLGTGFWDRELGEAGDRLTAAAEACGAMTLRVGSGAASTRGSYTPRIFVA